ncbi:unannotated protein [freshwater metagenome]|uniref:Unannotated protein n=1 Tax=freshwater metagenome TaxID=449393 RepID=A0A6J7I0F7_9ZZZZ
MEVRIGSGWSTVEDARVAAIEAGTDARQALDGCRPDLVVIFASGLHLEAAEATLEGVHEALAPRDLIGCGVGAVLAQGREFEDRSAVTVWAGSFPDAAIETFHLTLGDRDGQPGLDGLSPSAGHGPALLLPAPQHFPTELALDALAQAAPGRPVLGGVASALTRDGTPVLFRGADVLTGGAVGAILNGVEMLPCVSQGVAPIGPILEVTEADGRIIRTLDGVPALERLRAAIDGLSGSDRSLVSSGLLLGVAQEAAPLPEYLVQGLVGADPQAGTIAVGVAVEEGALVRLHARDAATAAHDLRERLALRREALDGDPAGALVFTCNGRGARFFGSADQDAGAVDEIFGGAPSAGFFAAGEIGPVAAVNLMHGFTATVAVFAA